MTRRNLFAFAVLSAALGFALSLPNVSPAQPKETAPIKIGMVKEFFTDLPDALICLITQPFPDLMKEVSGLDGKLTFADDAYGTAAKLDKGDLDVGVFYGHELAWMQQKYPKLRPLMVVVNNKHDVRAFVIVNKNSPVKKIADLRGKTIDVPAMTKEHCRVYVAKQCTDNALGNWKAFFGKVVKSATPSDALNDVCLGNADAALVDTIGLDFYKQNRGKVFENNLRVLEQSHAFPSAVIVYKDGAIPAAMLKRFCDGLLKAHNYAAARNLFPLWSIDAFELPPSTYNQSLTECLKAYPAPR